MKTELKRVAKQLENARRCDTAPRPSGKDKKAALKAAQRRPLHGFSLDELSIAAPVENPPRALANPGQRRWPGESCAEIPQSQRPERPGGPRRAPG